MRARGVERGRLRWLLAGAVVGLGPYVALVAVPRVFGLHSPILAELSILPMTLLPLCLGNAFVGRPLRLEDLARNSLVLGASVFLTAGAALAAAAVAAEVMRAFGLPGWVAYVAVALLVTAGFFDRFRRGLRDWIDASFDRAGYEARRTLVEFGRELAVVPQLPALSDALVDRLQRAFGLEQVAFYVSDESGSEISEPGEGDRQGGLLVRLAARPDAEVWPRRLEIPAGHPVRTRSLEAHELRRAARLDGVGADIDLGVPLVSRGRLVFETVVVERLGLAHHSIPRRPASRVASARACSMTSIRLS